MPDIINVSDAILRFATKTRLFSDTTNLSDTVTQTSIREVIKTLNETVTISEDFAKQLAKQRTISQTVNKGETLQAYKNDQELLPAAPPEVPTPQNIIGFRQRAVRVPRRAPRAILIEAELTNLIIAPLKILAFSDGVNTAIAGIRPQLVQNLALSATKVSLASQHLMLAQSQIKMQPQPMIVKAKLALLSSPEMWATAKLKTRPDTQSIHALKAVNFEKMHKLTRIMKIAMLANM